MTNLFSIIDTYFCDCCCHTDNFLFTDFDIHMKLAVFDFFFTQVIKMIKIVIFLHDFHTSWVTGERISMGSICYYVLILLYIHLALQQCINIHFFCMFWYLIFMYFIKNAQISIHFSINLQK